MTRDELVDLAASNTKGTASDPLAREEVAKVVDALIDAGAVSVEVGPKVDADPD